MKFFSVRGKNNHFIIFSLGRECIQKVEKASKCEFLFIVIIAANITCGKEQQNTFIFWRILLSFKIKYHINIKVEFDIL